MLNWLKPRNWGLIKVFRDFENYLDWIKTIKKEKANPESLYNKWKLSHTKLYDVYIVFSLDEVFSQLSLDIQRSKVVEFLSPVNRYFDDTLGFAECLTVEFNQFEDADGKPTLSYLIVYSFNWNKFSLKWLIKFIVITGLLIFTIIKLHIIPLLILWISNLIALL